MKFGQNKEKNEISKEISSLQDRVNNIYIQIGKLCMKNNDTNPMPEFSEMFEAIKETEKQIELKNARIKFLDGIVICTKCGMENSVEMSFCGGCRTKLPHTYTADGSNRCFRCGAVIAPGKKFCSSCGTPVATEAPAQPTQAAPVSQVVVETPVQPIAQPITQPVAEPIVQPVAQPVVEPTVQPVAELPVEPVAEAPVVEEVKPVEDIPTIQEYDVATDITADSVVIEDMSIVEEEYEAAKVMENAQPEENTPMEPVADAPMVEEPTVEEETVIAQPVAEEQVAEEPQTAANTPEPAAAVRRFCPQCGTPVNNSDAVFCAACGNKLR